MKSVCSLILNVLTHGSALIEPLTPPKRGFFSGQSPIDLATLNI